MIHPIRLATMYGDHVQRLGRAYADAINDAEYDALVIDSGAAAKQSSFDDQYWPHKPTPAFAHWLPLGEPNAALVIRPGDRPNLIRTMVTDFWESAPESPGDHFWNFFELAEVSDPKSIADHVPTGRIAFIGDNLERASSLGITDPAVNPAELVAALDRVRAIKSEYEIECIREANSIAMAGHVAVFDEFKAGGVSELDLHLLYLRVTGQDDAATPYKNIVAMGRNSAVLHHVRYQTDLSRDPFDSLLLDAGATFMGYASDITRTGLFGDNSFEVEGDEIMAEFGDLIGRTKGLQNVLIDAIQVGMPYEDLHDLAHERLALILHDMGIAEGSVEELVETGITRRFFPHGLGHSLGIQVHDVGCRERAPRPNNPFLRNTTVITAGQVFTIEPGLYFIEELLAPLHGPAAGSCDINWGAIERLSPFGGIRIEDNIAVREHGAENLTRGDNRFAKP